MRETASERKGEATPPAITSEKATAFLSPVLMLRIIANFSENGMLAVEAVEEVEGVALWADVR